MHVDIEPTQIGRVFAPDFGIVSDAKAALELFVEVARERKAAGKLKDRSAWAGRCRERKRTMLRKTNFDDVPIKPQRVYQEMNNAFGARHRLRHHHRPVARSPARSSCTSTSRATGSTAARPARWAGRSRPRWACARPTRRARSSALSGDYDFQFMIEELAVGAQFKLPYIHVVVNNTYLGLIRQSQRGFEMDYCVQLAFDNQNVDDPSLQGYGVDHVKVVEGLGCKAIRVHRPGGDPGRHRAGQGAGWREYQVPVVVEVILERVTNIAMGTEIDNDQRVRGHRLPPPPKAARAWSWPACWND